MFYKNYLLIITSIIMLSFFKNADAKYEKIFFDKKIQKQSGLSIVFPCPIEMAFIE